MELTIVDIARIAGVGVSTVSRVINNHPDVKETTRVKIQKVIDDNHYVPNNSARILKQTTSKNIGILVKGVFNPFFAGMLKNISMNIETKGYSTIVHYHNDKDDLATLIGFIKEKRLQGVICLGGDFISVDETSFKTLGVAIVMVNVDFDGENEHHNFSSVTISNEKAAYEATSYLIEKGHENIAIVLGDKNPRSISELRFKGYKRACEDAGIICSKDYVMYAKYDTALAYKEAKACLEHNKEITAIFATSDIMAIGVAKAISDLGMKVGKEVSVIGFDGIDVAKFYSPAIATIQQPFNELCDECIKLLAELLQEKESYKHIILDTNLIEGKSVRDINETDWANVK